MKKKLKAIDLFCGVGGLSQGFQNAGIDILAAFDNWKPAVESYKLNFNHPVYDTDLSNTVEVCDIIQKLSPDMIIGGPPCQDFSHAGKRDENGGRANLTIKFAEIIKVIRPKIFVMENVDRAEKSKAYETAIKIFKQSGYHLTPYLFDASLCGVPQKRKRFIVVGTLDGEDNQFIPYYRKNQSSKSMTLRDYFGDSFGFDFYYRHPRNYNRRGVFSIDEPSPTIRGVNRPVPSGYKGHPADPVKISGNIRPLTTIERSWVQTFPRDFKFAGSKTTIEQLIGNAVPVKLAEFVASSILEFVNSKNKMPYDLPSVLSKKKG